MKMFVQPAKLSNFTELFFEVHAESFFVQFVKPFAELLADMYDEL